jgi:hypothetical protein
MPCFVVQARNSLRSKSESGSTCFPRDRANETRGHHPSALLRQHQPSSQIRRVVREHAQTYSSLKAPSRRVMSGALGFHIRAVIAHPLQDHSRNNVLVIIEIEWFVNELVGPE